MQTLYPLKGYLPFCPMWPIHSDVFLKSKEWEGREKDTFLVEKPKKHCVRVVTEVNMSRDNSMDRWSLVMLWGKWHSTSAFLFLNPTSVFQFNYVVWELGLNLSQVLVKGQFINYLTSVPHNHRHTWKNVIAKQNPKCHNN